ncbi:sigma-54 interaction domain-containing protein [Fusobacterium sp. PH5-44]|uniref:sigma-54 interaction domain-containing protein n=1 Tax=unclassified Fusobacterium TaxID=2648384 RepID=UPI003D1A263D
MNKRKENAHNFICDMKSANEKLTAIIENSYDGIYITDGEANTIMINKNYELITGLNRTELIGRNMRELVDSKIISQSGTLVVIEKRKAVTLYQEFKTGKKALITSSPVFDKDKNLIMVVTNVRDMTEIHQLQDEVEKQNVLSKKTIEELDELKRKLNLIDEIVCTDEKSVSILQLANRVASTDATVLLSGETGVGKEVFAQYIYNNSHRKGKPFIRLNCGALTPTLIESELFGYEKGSFTGANREGKIGLFELADKGTIFLDEIGELPIDMQVKLLRILQDQEIIRIGGRSPIKINVRVIAATNKNLEELIRSKKFREDLYYRLAIFPIRIPPLRERIKDIIPLTELFVGQFNEKYGFKKSFAATAIKILENYDYPGNVRELKNIVERSFIMSNDDIITVGDLPIYSDKSYEFSFNIKDKVFNLKEKLEEIELDYINAAYEKHKNVRRAAKSLGMDPSTFVRKRNKKK